MQPHHTLLGQVRQVYMHYLAIMKFIAYLMILIANKQNQLTACRIENEKPIG